MKIIVEAGCNWHTIEEAKLFIDKSKELGLFATKFQIYNDDVIKDSEHYDFLKSIQLDYEKAKELFDYGKSIGQEVFFTPMFLEAVDWCEEIGVKYYKVRFKDNNNRLLLSKTMKTPYKKTVFISANDGVYKYHKDRVRVLYCIPKYPAKRKDYYKEYLYAYHGVSDHTKGTKLLKEAKKFGFEYFEKHMKLNDDCLESKWSVTFEQLTEVLNK